MERIYEVSIVDTRRYRVVATSLAEAVQAARNVYEDGYDHCGAEAVGTLSTTTVAEVDSIEKGN